ncbi:Rheb small monomeric GTPase RhbA [Rasamsonia emersonii CBS 393.64]|uniref:Rheb small monomeric GTPase RhbA n=1 Tax=Rasamsonia emersonii (strain ATCC 16479 / CBS 393.64 / IMI 116815) TaxID=1408163 RepID=A0A0F4YUT7_RASE3|nr:Rheb small monomeric GTPase RhbA [Rasamsonia emersonii CBS 393.64]KKA21860.1 Rheb small monomeric GTPase RhbA [Rasamsonia emersonii CBS 393.64]
MPAPPKQRKIAIVGSRSVGMRSKTAQSITALFKLHHGAAGLVYRIHLDEYSILNSKHFIGIHGYMIVYSVASRQSFDMVTVIREKILNHLGADWVPLVIVGNKSDLKPDQRQVSLEEGRQLGEQFHCAFTEASARLDYNVAKAFDLMIGEIEKSQNPSQPTGGSKCAVM